MRAESPALVAGVYEHPARKLTDVPLAQIHAEVARGALVDAGLELADVDGYFCGEDAPGWGAQSMAEYLGLHADYVDSTELGGATYVAQAGRAAMAIAAGLCRVALITQAGNPSSFARRRGVKTVRSDAPEHPFEASLGLTIPARYALAAQRHMHLHGTTSAELAAVKVAASLHAQHNPNARFGEPVTIDQVIDSPLISSPLHRLDCCVITDGGGAAVIVSRDVAKALDRPKVGVLSFAQASKHCDSGRIELAGTAAAASSMAAFDRAGVTQRDVDYASIYDSFTITMLMTLEDIGFCARGGSGRFVAEGSLAAPSGALPTNTDGGSLCNNHPGNRGGMIRLIEAVRQARGEAHPRLQVPDCRLALVHGTGGDPLRMASATLLLEAGD